MCQKLDLALNNLQWLICHKTKPNQTKPSQTLQHFSDLIRWPSHLLWSETRKSWESGRKGHKCRQPELSCAKRLNTRKAPKTRQWVKVVLDGYHCGLKCPGPLVENGPYINLRVLFNVKAILVEEQKWYYLSHSLGNKGVHAFPNGISPKVNESCSWISISLSTIFQSNTLATTPSGVLPEESETKRILTIGSDTLKNPRDLWRLTVKKKEKEKPPVKDQQLTLVCNNS